MENIKTELEKRANYKEQIEDSPAFQRGLEKIKNGSAETTKSIMPIWISRIVKAGIWNNYYSQISDYCFLEKTIEGVKMGFLATGMIPIDCKSLSDDEMLSVDNYRRANNILPTPFKKIENKV